MKDRFNIRILMEAEKKKAENIIKTAQVEINNKNKEMNMKID